MSVCSSFIGVSQSLPMTAYIKMIDIWMIFTMMYPFCVVTLYSVMEFLREDDLNKPVLFMRGTKILRSKKKIRTVSFLLDYGLPIFVTIFIIIFWTLGIMNTVAPAKYKSC